MTSKTYHISSDGAARPCSAREGKCPLAAVGSDHGNFETPELAREWAEQELSRSTGGSFGILAKQLVEREMREEIDKDKEGEVRRAKEAGDELREAAVEHDELFSLAGLRELAEARGIKKRRLLKQWAGVYEDFGLDPTGTAAAVYGAYLNNIEFDTATIAGRVKLRDRMAAGKFISRGGFRWDHSQALKRRLTTLEEALDRIPNENKTELSIEAKPNPSDIPELSNDDLTRTLVQAENRDWYIKQWSPEAKLRLVNYGKSNHSDKMRKFFGERYVTVVTEGHAHGYTEAEALYFEDQQVNRWAAYHTALRAETVERLNA